MVAGEEEAARGEQRGGHEIHVVSQGFNGVLYGQHGEKGQGAHDDQQDHPPGGGDAAGGGPVDQVAYSIEELQDHVPDILPVGGEDGEQGAQVEQHVEKGRAFRRAGDVQKMLGNSQMAGAGHRQELGHALDNAQEDGGKQGQGIHTPNLGNFWGKIQYTTDGL